MLRLAKQGLETQCFSKTRVDLDPDQSPRLIEVV